MEIDSIVKGTSTVSQLTVLSNYLQFTQTHQCQCCQTQFCLDRDIFGVIFSCMVSVQLALPVVNPVESQFFSNVANKYAWFRQQCLRISHLYNKTENGKSWVSINPRTQTSPVENRTSGKQRGTCAVRDRPRLVCTTAHRQSRAWQSSPSFQPTFSSLQYPGWSAQTPVSIEERLQSIRETPLGDS